MGQKMKIFTFELESKLDRHFNVKFYGESDGDGPDSSKPYLSQNAKRASARKDTGLDQSLFSVQLFRLRINIIKVCIRDQIRAI